MNKENGWVRLPRFLRSRSICGIPGYAAVPFLIDLAANMLTYYGSKVINMGRYHYDFTTALDSFVPVDGLWIPIYFGSYFFWAIAYILVARESEEKCFRLLGGNLICKALCLATFILLPTTNVRPDVTAPGFGNDMLRFLYAVDASDNLFPSMHCYMSWYATRWLGRRKGRTRVGVVLCYGFSFLVFYSTLATRQHYLIDVFGGVAVAEIALWLEKKWRPGRFYAWVDAKIQR